MLVITRWYLQKLATTRHRLARFNLEAYSVAHLRLPSCEEFLRGSLTAQ